MITATMQDLPRRAPMPLAATLAILGFIALGGMIMRNSIILVKQIQTGIEAGEAPWHPVVSAAVYRTRPVVLTALAAVLAMVPLTRRVFWGPMAIAIMGGLTVAIVLTIFFVPALCAAWFKVRREPAPKAAPVALEPALS